LSAQFSNQDQRAVDESIVSHLANVRKYKKDIEAYINVGGKQGLTHKPKIAVEVGLLVVEVAGLKTGARACEGENGDGGRNGDEEKMATRRNW
jgi:hypothetical protein